VSIDVEYPGVVARSIVALNLPSYVTSPSPYLLFDTLRCNVNLLSPIQIGFSFATPEGKLPHVEGKDVAAWQFNFEFSLKEELFAPESIVSLVFLCFFLPGENF
jgi:CCR4-NOT transcription complex subunit 7/8